MTIGGIPQARSLCGDLVGDDTRNHRQSYMNIRRRRSILGEKSGKYTPNESRVDLEENLRANHYAF